MKKCPECAESIQDEARKCRFCGFRLDAPVAPTEDATTDATTDATDQPPVLAPPTPAASWPRILGALGGLAVALGAAVMLVAVLSPSSLGEDMLMFCMLALTLGGAALGVAWFGFLLEGGAGFAVIGASFAVPVGFLIAWLLPSGSPAIGPVVLEAKAMIAFLGMALFALGHVFALAEGGFARLRAARAGAVLATAGLGGLLLAILRKFDIPELVAYALGLAGFGGLALLGLALTIGLPGTRVRN